MSKAQEVLLGRRSALVISLDFELLWGVRDHADRTTYGGNVLGERHAIPAMLELFKRYEVRATWASVGMAFAANKKELLDSAPSLRPTYSNPRLSNYTYFDEVGENEDEDPYYFGASLLKRIQDVDGQEIGSHTYSHYYCLEPGQTVQQFEADIKAAKEIASRRGIRIKSFVFPRNQRSEDHLRVLAAHGMQAFRGNESSWIYQPTAGASQPAYQRIARITDHYIDLSGPNICRAQVECGMMNIPASRFLRPYSRTLAILDLMRLKRITSAMTAAASRGEIFHLWWHPHNMGKNTGENLSFLEKILTHFRLLRDSHGMVALNMGDFV